MSDLSDEILGIVAQKAMIDRAALSLDAKLTELEIGSLDVVEIVFDIEEKYAIAIPLNANTTNIAFETVGDVLAIVEKLIQAKKQGRTLTEADLFPPDDDSVASTGGRTTT